MYVLVPFALSILAAMLSDNEENNAKTKYEGNDRDPDGFGATGSQLDTGFDTIAGPTGPPGTTLPSSPATPASEPGLNRRQRRRKRRKTLNTRFAKRWRTAAAPSDETSIDATGEEIPPEDAEGEGEEEEAVDPLQVVDDQIEKELFIEAIGDDVIEDMDLAHDPDLETDVIRRAARKESEAKHRKMMKDAAPDADQSIFDSAPEEQSIFGGDRWAGYYGL